MKRIIIGISVFIILISITIFFAWLGGYDFATRNSDVAFGFGLGAFISLVMAGTAATCPFID